MVAASLIASAQKSVNESKAKAMAENLKAGNYAAIVADFDTSLQRTLDTMRLRKMWEGLIGKNGPLKVIGATESEKKSQFDLVTQHLELETKKMDIKIVFLSTGKVRSFNFVQQAPPRTKYIAPDYAKEDQMEEKILSVTTGNFTLPGSLTYPKGAQKFPVVILVHGLGANDKDETLGPLKIFKDLSYGFAANGIGVFRYEKRQRQYGIKSVIDKNYTVWDEMLNDAISAVNAVKNDPLVDTNRIFLCGHSFGGVMLPRIANKVHVAGYILLSPENRPVEEVLLDQIVSISSMNPRFKSQEDTARAQVKVIKELKTNPKAATDSSKLLNLPYAYWMDMKDYSSVDAAKGIKKPILVMYGERDFQVVKKDFDAWKSQVTGKNVTYKTYADLNHFFITGKQKSTLEEYRSPGNFSYKAITDMAAWIKAIK